MMKSKLAKNGMITLPAELRKSLKIDIGDDVGFKKVDGEYIIYPIPKMHQLIDPDHLEGTKKLIEEMRRDRAKEE